MENHYHAIRWRNIVITGFMGSGTTSVGQEIARLLDWEFLDMDAIIEQRAGKSIAEIFAQEGEPVFREMEAALCRELAARSRVVIATGGGALVAEANREVMARRGLVVCLTCAPGELWRRLEAATDRPMLYTADRRARIESLLAQRTPAYARITHQIDTTAQSVKDAAWQILKLWQATQPDSPQVEETRFLANQGFAGENGFLGRDQTVIPVRSPAGDYLIYLGRGLRKRAGELLRQANLTGKVGLVSNSTVGPLYAESVESALRRAGFEVARCLAPDGEVYKTLDTIRTLYDSFIEAGLDRDSVVLALGGGVVGDMAGFAAATYLRGVSFVQMPASLLAMVDSSVGGKVAVDHPRGKNLIGAFKQPALVIADLDLLDTLPPAEYRSGLAEIIKAGIIASPPLFEYLERGGSGTSLWPIAEAIRIKVDVVEEDPYERGRRAILNLGHTFAHAIELLGDFQMRHGEAVSIGLVAAARTAEALELAKEQISPRVTACLRRHDLPTELPGYTPEAIWEAMGGDKKRRGGKLRFVLPRAIGDVIVTDEVPREVVLDVLCSMQNAT